MQGESSLFKLILISRSREGGRLRKERRRESEKEMPLEDRMHEKSLSLKEKSRKEGIVKRGYNKKGKRHRTLP